MIVYWMFEAILTVAESLEDCLASLLALEALDELWSDR